MMSKFAFRLMVMSLALTLVFGTTSLYAQQQLIGLVDLAQAEPVWSPNGLRVAYPQNDRVVIWDTSLETSMNLLGGNGLVRAIAWSPDGQQLASGTADKMINIWNSATGERVQSLIGHTEAISMLSWKPNGVELVSFQAEGENTLYLWNSQSGELIAAFPSGSPTDIAFNQDGSRLALVIGAEYVYLLDGETLEYSHSFGGTSDFTTMLNTVKWSQDDSLIVAASIGGGVYLWDSQTERLVQSFAGSAYFRQSQRYVPIEEVPLAWVRSVTFSPDGRQILSASGDGTVQVWDIATQTVIDRVQLDPIGAAAWSPDGTLLAYLPPKLVEQAPDGSLHIVPPDNPQLQIVAPFAAHG